MKVQFLLFRPFETFYEVFLLTKRQGFVVVVREGGV